MEQARVRVAGPSRAVLLASTTALVALTSAATALVVFSGTGSVAPRMPALEPLPPAAAAPAGPPVVVLPPGALGVAPPEPARRSSAGTRAEAVGSRAGGSAPLVLALSPALPAVGLLPPGQPSTPRGVVVAAPTLLAPVSSPVGGPVTAPGSAPVRAPVRAPGAAPFTGSEPVAESPVEPAPRRPGRSGRPASPSNGKVLAGTTSAPATGGSTRDHRTAGGDDRAAAPKTGRKAAVDPFADRHSAGKKADAGTSSAKKAAAKKAAAKKAAAKKASAKKATAKKAGATADKATPKKASAKRADAKTSQPAKKKAVAKQRAGGKDEPAGRAASRGRSGARP